MIIETKHKKEKIVFCGKPIMELSRDELLNCIEVAYDENIYYKDLYFTALRNESKALFRKYL